MSQPYWDRSNYLYTDSSKTWAQPDSDPDSGQTGLGSVTILQPNLPLTTLVRKAKERHI